MEGGARKIVVVGPGALGTLLAASLCRNTSLEVWLLDHNQERAATIAGQGLTQERDAQRETLPVHCTADPKRVGPAHYILLCVKAPTVPAALNTIVPLLGPNALLVCFQNGIGHLEVLQNTLAPTRWAAAVTSLGATLLGPGHVRFGGMGQTRMGFIEPVEAPAQKKLSDLAALLNDAGLPTETTPDIQGPIWNKLLVNVGINALTALYGCENGGLLENDEALARLEAAVLEGSRIARALGIDITPEPVLAVLDVCRATRHNISSMLQDIRAGRKTEIDSINGALVAKAADLGLAVPENKRLGREIHALEKNFPAHFP